MTRYVDTFPEEVEIDLKEVSEKLIAIEKNLELSNASIAQFSKELKIPKTF